MEFRTVAAISPSTLSIDHAAKIQLFGSCFVENIGRQLEEHKFAIDCNPFGVIYNPLSIAQSLAFLLDNATLTAEQTLFHADTWHSYLHHSSFSAPSLDQLKENVHHRLTRASLFLRNANWLVITFGSAYVYRLKSNGAVVANCHKQPEALFIRQRLSIDEIVGAWIPLIERLRVVNPMLKLLFTVSPIRHFRDGVHQNQLSKSTLLLAADQLGMQASDCSYFPSYELMMDDLRDYRFYADDMIHPSAVAIDYIWQRFVETYFTRTTRDAVAEWARLRKMINHRPSNPKGDEYRSFIHQTLLKLNRFSEKYPYLDVLKELDDLKRSIL